MRQINSNRHCSPDTLLRRCTNKICFDLLTSYSKLAMEIFNVNVKEWRLLADGADGLPDREGWRIHQGGIPLTSRYNYEFTFYETRMASSSHVSSRSSSARNFRTTRQTVEGNRCFPHDRRGARPTLFLRPGRLAAHIAAPFVAANLFLRPDRCDGTGNQSR